MNDMRAVIEPKSDQINADTLLGGPITVKITGVKIAPGTEQPVTIDIEGSKPWRPCKSMARVLVQAWGPDAKAYVGRSVTLYCDPTVKWGGMEVGGIRVSHMSHIDRDLVMALTATKGNKKLFRVKPLAAPQKQAPDADFDVAGFMARVEEKCASATTPDDLKAWWESEIESRGKLHAADQEKAVTAKATVTARLGELVAGSEV